MPVHSSRGWRAAPPRPDRAPSLGRRGSRAFAAATAGVVAAALLHALPAAGQQRGDDPRDRSYTTAIVNQALETERTNVEVPWSNPETGHRGTVVILRTYYRDGGSTPCRDYERTLERPGSPPVVTEGTGCRVGPVRWQLEERTGRAATTAREPRPLARPPADVEPAAGPEESPPRDTRSTEREDAEPEAPTRREPAEASAAETPSAARASAAEPEPPPAFPTYTMPSKAEL